MNLINNKGIIPQSEERETVFLGSHVLDLNSLFQKEITCDITDFVTNFESESNENFHKREQKANFLRPFP